MRRFFVSPVGAVKRTVGYLVPRPVYEPHLRSGHPEISRFGP